MEGGQKPPTISEDKPSILREPASGRTSRLIEVNDSSVESLRQGEVCGNRSKESRKDYGVRKPASMSKGDLVRGKKQHFYQ